MARTVALSSVQPTFDELGTPLREVTFVVVDLETTGGSYKTCEITEVGAVRVRAGEVLGEFQSLVRPSVAIPAFIAVLTGITDSMVAGAPPIGEVLPAFLEFAAGSVLVAHNAPFDVGFLRAACAQTSRDWPAFDVVDTARLAAKVVSRDESPDCKLSSLARLFRAQTTPVHRALADAQATVDVLHGLLGRLGGLGVHSLEELRTYTSLVSPMQRRKRHLAEGLPATPGVYVFRDGAGQVLYIGKSRNLRARVRGYFTASETRSRMGHMVACAEQVDHIPCATGLEAEVRELRLIAEHSPRFNRRSRWPERANWVVLTDEAFPRLSVVRTAPTDGRSCVGPIGSRATAEAVVAALHEALPLRQCRTRLSRRATSSACALAEIGRCGAPCTGDESVADYAAHVAAASVAMVADPDVVVRRLTERMAALSEATRYEEARAARDRLSAFLRATAATQRLTALAAVAQLVAARIREDGGWEIHVIRHGRLVAAGISPRGGAPRPFAEALVATAETVRGGLGPTPCATAEEMRCVLRWLSQSGVRLVEISDGWVLPSRSAASWQDWVDAADAARPAAEPLADRRGLRPAGAGTAPLRVGA